MNLMTRFITVSFLFYSVLITAGCQGTTLTSNDYEGASEVAPANEELQNDVLAQLNVLPPSRSLSFEEGERQPSEPPPQQKSPETPPVQEIQETTFASKAPEILENRPAARPVTQSEIISSANQFFNSFTTLSGRFTQINHDRQKQTGSVHILRPGRMRFDYNAPSTLQIIADGQNVAIRNTKTARQELYPLSQTPIQFLLKREIRLDRDLKIINTRADRQETIITVEDRSTLGGTARITLFFNPAITTLKSWDVTDAQGRKTTVILNNIQMNSGVGAENFVIPMKYRN